MHYFLQKVTVTQLVTFFMEFKNVLKVTFPNTGNN